MTAWYSLRRRLVLTLLGGVSIGWLVMLATSYIDAHHEIDELFDAQLAQTAQALLARRDKHKRDDDDDREMPARLAHPYQSQIMFQIWRHDGLALRSPNAPSSPLADRDGFTDTRKADGNWRIFSQWDERRRHRVQVAENHEIRDELIRHIAWRLLMPALIGLPLMGAWVWLATRRGLAPIGAIADQIARREPNGLHAVVPEVAPWEIRPLIEAINSLFRRVEQAMESERRFTADAAHELRTPLAALGTQAQVVLRARDEAERQHAVGQLIASARRSGHLVDQLLTLARLDPEKGQAREVVSLDRLAEDVCADHGAPALEKHIALELDARPAVVAGNADLLRILLRNLIDNAVRYTPTGGRIAVSVGVGEDVVLSVSDTGPGIPEGERQRVFDRFHRLAGQDTEGSGLGLSIVARIADIHGARITLAEGDNGAGLRATVRFPLPAQSPG